MYEDEVECVAVLAVLDANDNERGSGIGADGAGEGL